MRELPIHVAPAPARQAWLAAGLLLGAVAVFLGPAVLQGKLLAPGDGIGYLFEQRVLIAEGLRHGQWPFWNPFVFGGMPELASIQGGTFFPGNWTFLCLPPVAAMNLAVALAYWLGGFGAYGLARHLGRSFAGALIAGLAFMLGGFMVAHMDNLNMVQVAALLPWQLWMVERFRQSLKARDAIAGCAVTALALFAGHPMTTALSELLVVSYAIFRGASLGDRASRLAYGGQLTLMFVLALGTASLQLLPALDFIPLTQRKLIGYDQLVSRSLPPRQLLTLLFPFFFGARPSSLFPTVYWGEPHPVELTGYVGLGVLALAAAALGRWRADAQVRFWGLAALIAGLLALGRYTPLYQLVVHLPVLNTMPIPGRHLMEVDLALGVLAAHGLDRLTGMEARARRRALWASWLAVAVPVFAIAIAIALVGQKLAARARPFLPGHIHLAEALRLQAPAVWVPVALAALTGLLMLAWPASAPARGRWQAALVALVAADLLLFADCQGWWDFAPRVSAAMLPAAPGRTLDAERTLPISAAFVYAYEDFEHLRAMHYPYWGSLAGERSLTGTNAFIPDRFARLLDQHAYGDGMRDDAVWAIAHHGLDLFTLRTVRLDARLGHDPRWLKRLAPPRWQPRTPLPGGVLVFENRRALPPVWRPARATVLPAALVDRHVSADASFNPREQALVEAPLARPLSPSAVGDSARVMRRAINQLSVQTTGAGNGLLAVAEGYDPGWRAFANGRELPLHRLDGLILGVEVPAGPQDVSLVYEPRRWRLGIACSLVSLLAIALWAGWAAFGKKVRASRRGS